MLPSVTAGLPGTHRHTEAHTDIQQLTDTKIHIYTNTQNKGNFFYPGVFTAVYDLYGHVIIGKRRWVVSDHFTRAVGKV